jgi:hypothetical protein
MIRRLVKGLGMRLAFALVMASAPALARAQLASFETVFNGSVNGGAVAASGGGVVDLDQDGRSFASVTFTQRPASFDPLAPSLISNLCANAFQAEGDEDNLFSLSGGTYQVSRAFSWLGVPNSNLFIESTVTWDGTSFDSISTLSGTYNGPTDIVGISSYAITWLPSSAPGEFFESGTAVLERANGESLIVQFASVFSGLERDLEQVQFGTGFFDTSFDGENLTLGWDGFFVVPSPSGLAVFALVGVAAGRRRR